MTKKKTTKTKSGLSATKSTKSVTKTFSTTTTTLPPMPEHSWPKESLWEKIKRKVDWFFTL